MRCVMYKNRHDARLNLHFYQMRGKHDERDSEGVNLISNFTAVMPGAKFCRSWMFGGCLPTCCWSSQESSLSKTRSEPAATDRNTVVLYRAKTDTQHSWLNTQKSAKKKRKSSSRSVWWLFETNPLGTACFCLLINMVTLSVNRIF